MGLTVADVAELPERMVEPNRGNNISHGRALGFNEALDEISSLPLSPEKVVGIVEIDEEKLTELLRTSTYISPASGEEKQSDLSEKYCGHLARFLISNKSKILGLKGKNEKNH